MKKSKKKGFTLIELLAVIVIFAVVLAVTVPIIVSSMRTARLTQLHSLAVSIAKWYDESATSDSLGMGENILGNKAISVTNTWRSLSGIAGIYGLSSDDVVLEGNTPSDTIEITSDGQIKNLSTLNNVSSSIRINSDGSAEVLLIAKDGGKFDTNGSVLAYAFSFGDNGFDSIITEKKNKVINRELTDTQKQAYVDDMADDIMRWYIDVYIEDNQDLLAANDEIYFFENSTLTDSLFDYFSNYENIIDVNATYMYKNTVNSKNYYCVDLEVVSTSVYSGFIKTDCYEFNN